MDGLWRRLHAMFSGSIVSRWVGHLAVDPGSLEIELSEEEVESDLWP